MVWYLKGRSSDFATVPTPGLLSGQRSPVMRKAGMQVHPLAEAHSAAGSTGTPVLAVGVVCHVHDLLSPYSWKAETPVIREIPVRTARFFRRIRRSKPRPRFLRWMPHSIPFCFNLPGSLGEPIPNLSDKLPRTGAWESPGRSTVASSLANLSYHPIPFLSRFIHIYTFLPGVRYITLAPGCKPST